MNFSITKPSLTCKECGRSFSSVRGLNLHVSKSEQGLPDYYHKHYPRRDKHSMELIEFNSFSQYCKTFFNSKTNEKKWIEANGAEDWYKFKIDKLIKNSTHKYRYSWIEWVSRGNLPYDDIPNFEEILKSSKLKRRFYYEIPKWDEFDLDEEDIYVDTREKKPLFAHEKRAINAGDYILGGRHYNTIHIDRKSTGDFISTFTGGRERFEREMDKITKLDAYMVVLVENDFWSCATYRPKAYTKQRVGGPQAMYTVRQLMQKYVNLQFLFVEDREHARQMCKLLLANPRITKTHDLQYLYVDGRIPLQARF
jgi:hypothetical protein